jgi:hypothetical protein
MRSKGVLRHLAAFLLSILLAAVAHSASPDLNTHYIQDGGIVDLPLGSFVEGSARHNGIQPDYSLSVADRDLAAFLSLLRETVNNEIAQLEPSQRGYARRVFNRKIEIVTAMIQKALPEGGYHAEAYRNNVNDYRTRGRNITLGSYLRCAAGVCRENALLTHLSLKAVGIENHYVYAKTYAANVTEDHAFVIVNERGINWIVDPYTDALHGREYEFMQTPESLTQYPDKFAGFAKPNDYTKRILEVNNYPRYWIPRPSCRNIF